MKRNINTISEKTSRSSWSRASFCNVVYVGFDPRNNGSVIQPL